MDLPELQHLSALRLVYRREIPATPLKMWDWYRRAHATDRLLPPSRFIEILKRPVHLFTGAILLLRWHFLFWHSDIRIEHTSHEVGKYFYQRMVRGPLLRWKHQHHFIPWKDGVTLLEDRIDIIATRYEWINQWIHPLIEKKLDKAFIWRHHIAQFDLSLWTHLPFAGAAHAVCINPGQIKLTHRLRAALEPIPINETDPEKLTSVHEGATVVLNAIGLLSQQIPQNHLKTLARVHARTLICLGHSKEPRWLATLSAYGDRIIYIQVTHLLKPWMRRPLKWLSQWGWQPTTWSCEEDLLSAIFQIIHDRPSSGRFSIGAHDACGNRPKRASWIRKLDQWLNEKLHLKLPQKQYLPALNLRKKAFSSIHSWLKVYSP